MWDMSTDIVHEVVKYEANFQDQGEILLLTRSGSPNYSQVQVCTLSMLKA